MCNQVKGISEGFYFMWSQFCPSDQFHALGLAFPQDAKWSNSCWIEEICVGLRSMRCDLGSGLIQTRLLHPISHLTTQLSAVAPLYLQSLSPHLLPHWLLPLLPFPLFILQSTLVVLFSISALYMYNTKVIRKEKEKQEKAERERVKREKQWKGSVKWKQNDAITLPALLPHNKE